MANEKRGWIGVDLDGTLVELQTGEFQPEVVGKPVPRMVDRVKRWLAEGKDVRIFTARVNECSPDWRNQEMLIRSWCMKNIGQALIVTCQKDYMMIELWDDRAIQVVPNEGRRVDGKS